MSICDYLNYEKAWITIRQYCKGSSDIADKKTLEALSIVVKYEQTQKDKRIAKILLRNSKKTA